MVTDPTAREVLAVALQGIVGDPGAEDGDPREHAGQVLAALAAAGWAVVQVATKDTQTAVRWANGDVALDQRASGAELQRVLSGLARSRSRSTADAYRGAVALERPVYHGPWQPVSDAPTLVCGCGIAPVLPDC